jgi:hypothetical protein
MLTVIKIWSLAFLFSFVDKYLGLLTQSKANGYYTVFLESPESSGTGHLTKNPACPSMDNQLFIQKYLYYIN